MVFDIQEKAEMDMMHEIEATRGIDEVRFGMSVMQLESLGYVENRDRYNEIIRWRSFSRDDTLVCYVKDDVFIAYACFEDCCLHGRNLIGLSEFELMALLGQSTETGESIWVGDEEQQVPFEYESVGLQIWFERGRVISVFGDAGDEFEYDGKR